MFILRQGLSVAGYWGSETFKILEASPHQYPMVQAAKTFARIISKVVFTILASLEASLFSVICILGSPLKSINRRRYLILQIHAQRAIAAIRDNAFGATHKEKKAEKSPTWKMWIHRSIQAVKTPGYFFTCANLAILCVHLTFFSLYIHEYILYQRQIAKIKIEPCCFPFTPPSNGRSDFSSPKPRSDYLNPIKVFSSIMNFYWRNKGVLATTILVVATVEVFGKYLMNKELQGLEQENIFLRLQNNQLRTERQAQGVG